MLVEWLRPGDEPVDTCGVHRRVQVDVRNGLLASRQTPRRYLEARSFVEPEPRWASWAAAAGLVPPPTAVSRLGATVVSAVDLARLSLAAPASPTPPSAKDPALRVTSPHDGAHVLADPETPRGMATLAFEAEVRPRVAQLVWYVHGAPFAVAHYPYTARWPLRPGEHRFEARLPYAPVASAVVSVRVE